MKERAVNRVVVPGLRAFFRLIFILYRYKKMLGLPVDP
jgi:hypothetical protein